MRIPPFLLRAKVKGLLSERIPNGKHFSRSEKVNEFLPTALGYRWDGFDFEIIHNEEEGHLERVRDTVVSSDSLDDGNCCQGYGAPFTRVRMASGAEFTWSPWDTMDEDWADPTLDTFYDKWIVDKPESIQIRKGRRLTTQQDGSANGSQPFRSQTGRTSSAAGSRR